jgi:hypothetical protein
MNLLQHLLLELDDLRRVHAELTLAEEERPDFSADADLRAHDRRTP